MWPHLYSPTPEEVFQGILVSDQGAGVLLIIKNFEKDVESFLAGRLLAMDQGHQVAYVIVNDDCSLEENSFQKRRRGVAGTVFVHKILAAAAESGLSLEDLKTLGEKVVRASNTLGLALSPAVVSKEHQAQFQLAEDELSIGVGIHGEPGYRIEKLHSSERLAIELVNKLKNHYPLAKGDQFALMVNGLGGTPLMELYIFTNDVRRLLELEGIKVVFKKVGNYMTSYDMKGLSLTFLKVEDDCWLDWLKEPVEAYGW